MMKRIVVNQDIKRLVFITESSWILHFGNNFEELVLRGIRDKVPVIRINNVNGNTTALPLDRAKYLLDKYYKLTGKPIEEQGELEKHNSSSSSHLFTEKPIASPDFKNRKMAANGF